MEERNIYLSLGPLECRIRFRKYDGGTIVEIRCAGKNFYRNGTIDEYISKVTDVLDIIQISHEVS